MDEQVMGWGERDHYDYDIWYSIIFLNNKKTWKKLGVWILTGKTGWEETQSQIKLVSPKSQSNKIRYIHLKTHQKQPKMPKSGGTLCPLCHTLATCTL